MKSNSITFNGTTFSEVIYILDGEEMPGLLIHDVHDTYSDGDMIVENVCGLPETADDAEVILSESGLTAFHVEGDKYIID